MILAAIWAIVLGYALLYVGITTFQTGNSPGFRAVFLGSSK